MMTDYLHIARSVREFWREFSRWMFVAGVSVGIVIGLFFGWVFFGLAGVQ